MVDPVFPVDAQWEYDVYQLMEEMDKKDQRPYKKETPKKTKKKRLQKKDQQADKANLRGKKKSSSEKQ